MGTIIDLAIESFPRVWHIWLVGSVLTIISLGFLFGFVVPACKLGRELQKAIDKLSEIKQRADGGLVDLSEIADGPMQTPNLAHAWSEYAETLHPQKEGSANGEDAIIRWRATALAETFFSEHAIVYTPLKADFYQHLPGILTGLGIIGTFLGLIMGLWSFEVSDPTKAQAELKNLINAVGHAFFVSAAAISLAMLVTWVEKSIVTARNRQVTKLRQIVDSLFDAGAGEEYLEKMVRASETQATQAMQIKDALVADIQEILTTLTERQLQESRRMAENLGQVISDRLREPVSVLTEAVNKVGANQGEAVNKLLTDVLVDFSAKLEGMFGDQIQGMTDLLKQTSEVMRQSAEKFAALATDMDAAGTRTVDAMGERLNFAIALMEERQRVLNTRWASSLRRSKRWSLSPKPSPRKSCKKR